MRAVCLLSTVAAMALHAGCTPDNGAVLMRLDARTPDFIGPASYASSATEVVFHPDGSVFFAASSNQGVLRVLLPSPLVPQTTVALPGDQDRVQLEVGKGGWANQGGSVFVISADPAIIRLLAVPMVARSGDAGGSFVFNGDGTFQ